ncbi:hypothetical protein TYM08_P3154 [Marinicellulosiphila megalodicopiae]
MLQGCTTLDFGAIEDNWDFDVFRQYALLRCTAGAFQNEQQFEIAKQYFQQSETYLAKSRHGAYIFYFLGQQSNLISAELSIEHSGSVCMDWVLSKDFEYSIVQKLSSPL